MSCYPNAGLPNPLSATGFDLGPHDMARYLGDVCSRGAGQHCPAVAAAIPLSTLSAIARALEGVAPRKLPAAAPAEPCSVESAA